MAREPESCGKCHLGPDHPQYEIYNESKHGIAFYANRDRMALDKHGDWVLGRDYSAREAFDMGMVNAVIPHAELEPAALEWAREITAKSPTAQRMLKYAFNLQDDGLVGQQLFAGEATRLAYRMRSKPVQYAGLGRYIVAKGTIFVPLLYHADRLAAGVIEQAAQAGTLLADIEHELAQHNQMLAFEPVDLGPALGKQAGQTTIGIGAIP